MKNHSILTFIISFGLSILLGQTARDLQDAKKLYEEYKSGELKIGQQILLPDTSLGSTQFSADTLFRYKSKSKPDEHLKHFGYDYFTLRDSIQIWPNVSIPDYYVLGPGDNIEITIWGMAQVKVEYIIDRDGNLYDERIGLVSLDGKTLKEARIILFSKFSNKIASLGGDNPTSFINVSVGKLKSINVHFVGNVKYPGIHLLHPLSSIVNGLMQAGGIDTTGTMRKIQLKRKGALYKEIDLYNFLLQGEGQENIILQNNDVIVVPTRISTVTVDGEVFNPGIYEALGNETIADVIVYSGGIKAKANDKAAIKRLIPYSIRKQNKPPYEFKSIARSDFNNEKVFDNDIIQINSLPNVTRSIEISGNVKKPGSYDLTGSMTLSDILYLAGGIEDPEYLKSVYDNIAVLRVNELRSEAYQYNFSLKEILNKNQGHDFILEDKDKVIVYENIYYKNEKLVKIRGEVNVPGDYYLSNVNPSLSHIIDKAKGLTEFGYMSGLTIFRNDKKVIWGNSNTVIQPGDSLYIPIKPLTVEVRGEIYNPGYIQYKKGKRVKDYIESGGGYKPNGSRRDVLVIYPNGNVKTKGLFPRKVIDGCTIVVNPKPEREPFDFSGFLTDALSITSSILLTYLAIERIQQ